MIRKYEGLKKEMKKQFAKDDEFWFIDNSDFSDNTPIKASLSESFADIYQDMKDFVILYQKSSLDAKENAVFELKQLFDTNWGYRIVNSQKALHYLNLSGKQEGGQSVNADLLF